ncbi:hypothetical protein Tcan_10834 [Toxocara canis]|uniref:Uncharacterized protein n=1 Tax=Toxocara canis TaxID=6265 RepID=A0A0B2UT10_TOXCA|nr:hypothetical protein Tcan_10834 [Toxocara canis]
MKLELTSSVNAEIETPTSRSAREPKLISEALFSRHEMNSYSDSSIETADSEQSRFRSEFIKGWWSVGSESDNFCERLEMPTVTDNIRLVNNCAVRSSNDIITCATNTPVSCTIDTVVKPNIDTVVKPNSFHSSSGYVTYGTYRNDNLKKSIANGTAVSNAITQSRQMYSRGETRLKKLSKKMPDWETLPTERYSGTSLNAKTKESRREGLATNSCISADDLQEFEDLTSQVSTRFSTYLSKRASEIRGELYYGNVGPLLESLCDFICSEFVLRQELANTFSSSLRGLIQLRFSKQSHELRCLEALQRSLARHFNTFMHNNNVVMFHRRLKLNFLVALKVDVREELERMVENMEVDSDALEGNLTYLGDMLKCPETELHELTLQRCSPFFDVKLHQKEAATKINEKYQRLALSKFRSILLDELRHLYETVVDKRNEIARCHKNNLQSESAIRRFSRDWQTLRKTASGHGELMKEFLKYVDREIEYTKDGMIRTGSVWNRHSLAAQMLIAIVTALQKLVIERFRHLKLTNYNDHIVDATSILLPETCAARTLAMRKMADFYTAAKYYASLDWENEVRFSLIVDKFS